MMFETPDMRRQTILQWLREQKDLSIEELVNRLGVSTMTVHRDLDHLAKEGLVQKSYGHVALVEARAEPAAGGSATCALCGNAVPHRSAFIAQASNGVQIHACCPHCGLMLLKEHPKVYSALTRDFIYGRMVDVMHATYVVESRVLLCCVPGVLCFASTEDATSFAQGFGGIVMTFEEALTHLSRHPHHHAHIE